MVKNSGATHSGVDDAVMSRVMQFTKPRDPDRKVNYRMAVQGDAAEIYMYDMIGEWGISARQFADDLKGLGKVKAINLRINSEGGDVFEGRAIYTLIAQHPARVVARIDGIAASVASLIAMAANEIRMADGSFMMIHNAWTVSVGNADEMRRTADLLESVDATIVDTYAARTKQKAADVKVMMAAETWMSAQDARVRGFADVVDEPLKIAAAVRHPEQFRHTPSALLPRRAAAVARLAALKHENPNHDERGQFAEGPGGGSSEGESGGGGNGGIAHHLGKLTDAGGNREKFDAAVAALKADKSINKDNLGEISRAYGMHVYTRLSKDGYHKEIEKAFVRHGRLGLHKNAMRRAPKNTSDAAEAAIKKLIAAGSDRKAFDSQFDAIKADDFSENDLLTIASGYVSSVYPDMTSDQLFVELERLFADTAVANHLPRRAAAVARLAALKRSS